MQAHIDRLEQVAAMLKESDDLLAGVGEADVYYGQHFDEGQTRLRDARQLLGLTIDDLSLDDGSEDAKADAHVAEGPSLSDEVEQLMADVRTLHQQVRCRYYGLAGCIMRELGHPALADDINQCLYAEANRGALSPSAGEVTPNQGATVRSVLPPLMAQHRANRRRIANEQVEDADDADD